MTEGSPQWCGAGFPSGMIILLSTSSHLHPPLARGHNPGQISFLRINMHNCSYLFNVYPWKWIPHSSSVKWLQISCNWASRQRAALMHSVFSHHDRLVLLTFTLISCPLMPQPDTNPHRWTLGGQSFLWVWNENREVWNDSIVYIKKKSPSNRHFFVTLSDWSFLLNLCEAL